MVKGDAYAPAIITVSANGYANIRPPEGIEIVVHNIAHSGSAQLEKYDGTQAVTVDTVTGGVPWMGMFLHCTYDVYYRVKDLTGATSYVGYDGVVSK